MKNFILSLASLFIFYQVFAQEKNPEMTSEDYNQMSKSQQTGGIILLGAGITAFAIASQGNINFDDLPTVLILGGLATVGGTTLLIASGKNKRKAKSLSAGLSFKNSFPQKLSLVHSKPLPLISLKLEF